MKGLRQVLSATALVLCSEAVLADPSQIDPSCGATKADQTLVFSSPIESGVFHHMGGVSKAWSYRRTSDGRLCGTQDLPISVLLNEQQAEALEQDSLAAASGIVEAGTIQVLEGAQGFVVGGGCQQDTMYLSGSGATQISPHIAISSYLVGESLQQSGGGCFYPAFRGESFPNNGRNSITSIQKASTLGSTVRGLSFIAFQNPVVLSAFPRLEFHSGFSTFAQAYQFGIGGGFSSSNHTVGVTPPPICSAGVGGTFGLLFAQAFGELDSYGAAFRDSQIPLQGIWRGHSGGLLTCSPISGGQRYLVFVPGNPEHYQIISNWVLANAAPPPSLEIEGLAEGTIVRAGTSYPVSVSRSGTTDPVVWTSSQATQLPAGDSGGVVFAGRGSRSITVRSATDSTISRTKFVSVIAPGGTITASQSQVVIPPGVNGEVDLSWQTQDLMSVRVTVSLNGGSASEISTSSSGSETLDWIQPGVTYDFRLLGVPVGSGGWEEFGSATVLGIPATSESVVFANGSAMPRNEWVPVALSFLSSCDTSGSLQVNGESNYSPLLRRVFGTGQFFDQSPVQAPWSYDIEMPPALGPEDQWNRTIEVLANGVSPVQPLESVTITVQCLWISIPPPAFTILKYTMVYVE